MRAHEEFLELCAAATAGELSAREQAKLDAHLAVCQECRRAMNEYELAAQSGVAALASELAPKDEEPDGWSVAKAEEAFFRRLGREEGPGQESGGQAEVPQGQRYAYRPSEIRWREVWMPFAAAVLLAVALGIAAYRTGVKRGPDVARTLPVDSRDTERSLEEQASDAGQERAQLARKLVEEDRIIADLRRQLSEQLKEVQAFRATDGGVGPSSRPPASSSEIESGPRRQEELTAAQAKVEELQKAMDTLTRQREEENSRA